MEENHFPLTTKGIFTNGTDSMKLMKRMVYHDKNHGKIVYYDLMENMLSTFKWNIWIVKQCTLESWKIF